MSETLQRWLFDPTIGRLVVVVIALAVIATSIRLLSRSAGRYIEDIDARYRVRKLLTFAGYAVSVFVVTLAYSSQLAGLTVAFGVAGAGIAFALQEVIASVAGWIALTFSRFYGPGDRIQLGGIKGDVIDIGVLRTTLMEIGDWVQGDLYNGRVVRVANSYVFKEPVYNYSADFPFLWDEIRVPIRFGSDRAEARRLLEHTTQSLVGAFTQRATEAWAVMLRTYRLDGARLEPLGLRPHEK